RRKPWLWSFMCTATARKIFPSRKNRLPNVASQMRVAFASMASKTGPSSPGELEMTFKTSDVAVCCSCASFSSRVRALICSCGPAAENLRRRAVLGVFWRFNVLGRCVLPSLLPVLLRRLIASPEAQDRASYRQNSTLKGGGVTPANVRFGSKADMCRAKRHVRFASKADMCGATRDVRFGPKADIESRNLG